MCATAADLVEDVLPEADLRQWVLTFPFAWRARLGQDGALFATLSRPRSEFLVPARLGTRELRHEQSFALKA
jgi:hypothetical protein